MARIRTVKPELFRHEELFEAEKESGLPLRIAFIALFTVCDREGRFKWRPRQLKLDCLPYDEIDFQKILEALLTKGFLNKYSIDGDEFGVLPTFKVHQVINIREAKSVIPEPTHYCEANQDKITHVHARADTQLINGIDIQCTGTNIPKTIKAFVFDRDGFACVLCGREDSLHIDHILPISIGGTYEASNLRVLCESCNCSSPVCGDELLKDLEIDGLTINEMESMCTHVHAQGEKEGKGREKEGKGREKEKEGKGNTREPRAKKIKTHLPIDFVITDEIMSWYESKGFREPIHLHFESFKNKCLAKGYQYVDWGAAFRNAISDDWAGIRKSTINLNNSRNQQPQTAQYIPQEQRGRFVSNVIEISGERL